MAGSSLALAPAAFASDGSHHYALHQPTPILASEASHDGDCPTIPADKDGWHFVIPTNGVNFVKLTVTFEPGGEQVITSFGPPSDKHAYVASEPGAKLVSAEADVDGVIKQGWFNLSHTCVATSTTGGTTGEQTTGGSTTGEQTTGGSTTGEQTTGGSTTGETTTGETTTGETTTGETTTGGSTTGETTTGGSTTGETTATGGSASGETSATGGSTTGGSATGETSATGGSATGGEVKDENGNLAETGSSAPVGIIAAVALALAAAGAVLVTRRRKAQQN
ncbi:LPXTG cell wall anchor domain-containing protein [Streptomyces nymphaeiformis]|uniref:LPXTG-motif cell wall-anchored protein n=1 Tax=Streptomyces nymphaeiformis TaxID=2663842 RepID=A0A7W7XFA8_9ACTN|nr:LPXTG cell wall anchor domain-containing protein [Streptomyces nymphaeiformis]MBB4986012.1 LPXTG-motif cell wall-anchored protein [Streptomyces nymphaeiformis]